MIPVRLIAVNFCQHACQTFDYEVGITGILGSNGTGKSNFIDAAQYFGITGQTPKGVNKDEALRWGCHEGYVQFEFIHGGTEYTVKRNLHNANAVMTWTEADGKQDSLKGSSKINKLMEEFLGMDFDLFRETRFCGQDDLVAIFRHTPSERLEYFQKIAGVKRAETLRTVIQQQINKLPNLPDRSTEIEQMQAAKAEAEAALAALEVQQATTFQGVLPGSPAFNEAYQAAVQAANAPSIEALQQQAANLQQQVVAMDAALQAELAKLPPSPGPAPVENTPEDNTAYQQTQIRNQLLQEQQNLQLQAVAVPPEPVAPDGADCEKAAQMLQEGKPRYDMMVTGSCPTCKRAYDTKASAEFVEWYKQLTAAYQQMKTVYDPALRQYQQDLQAYQYAVRANAAIAPRLVQVEARLAAINVGEFDVDQYLQRAQAMQTWSQAQAAHQRAIQAIGEPGKRARIESLQAQAAELLSRPGATPEQLAEARQQIAQFDRLRQQWQDLQTERKVLEATHTNTQTILARYEKEQAAAVKTNALRQRLELCRDVLHRENLPAIIMRQFMAGINSYIAEYLGHFNTEFTAQITDDFDFIAEFRGRKISTSRLSGGQKVALAIAFRFAMADMVGRSAPLLVMDEPTIWLDDNNIDRVTDVLQAVRRITEKGVYIMIATHEPRILSAMNRQVVLGEAV